MTALLRRLLRLLIPREPSCRAPGCIADPNDGHTQHVNARGESWRERGEVES